MTTLKHLKWVKLGTLLKTPERKLKENSLATARAKNKNQNKNSLARKSSKEN